MLRLLAICLPVLAMGYSDILSRRGGTPVEVVDVALESATTGAVAAARLTEERRSEAARLATLSQRRTAAEKKLNSLLSMEKLHAMAVADVLG